MEAAATGSYLEAKELLGRSVALDPDHSEARQALERIENSRQRYEAAVQPCEGMNDEKRIDQLRKCMESLEKAKTFDPEYFRGIGGEELLEAAGQRRAEELRKQREEAYNCVFSDGQMDECIRKLEPLAEEEPTDVELQSDLGVAYAKKGRDRSDQEGDRLREKAKRQFCKALTLQRDHQLPQHLVRPDIRQLFTEAASECDGQGPG